jgi:hypothetical protein
MTRLKSAYRPKKFRDGGAVMAEEIAPAPIAVPTDADSVGIDDASLAFQQQIASLRRAEAAQQQRGQAAPQPTRAERLNKLRQEGLSEAAVSFLGANHEVMDYPHLADQAARIARDEGYLPDTEAFFQAVKSNFRNITTPPEAEPSEALETAQKYSGAAPMPSPHDEASLERSRQNRVAAMVSAPVSREVPTSIREDRGISSRVTLSILEKEIARSAGISEVDYATGKLELARRKAAGEI